jgi:hypothetical protein
MRGLIGLSAPSASARMPKPSHLDGVTTHLPLTVWPFALYAAFPRADYYGHADSLRTHPRFWDEFPRPYFRSR